MNGQELQSLKELLEEKFTNVHHRLDEVKSDTEKMDLKLDKLPCGVMRERVKNINGRINWIWAVMLLILAGMVAIKAVAK
ncbi:hypothetical protein D4R71_00525 [bacterium]|nr:MAG: hypothetical protein D4R71_00525 [bacterium]